MQDLEEQLVFQANLGLHKLTFDWYQGELLSLFLDEPDAKSRSQLGSSTSLELESSLELLDESLSSDDESLSWGCDLKAVKNAIQFPY